MDKIEKTIDIAAPVSRVWRALTDHAEFGEWFRVALDQPFAEGALSTGQMTYPGFEGCPWRATVERIDPERTFRFRWHDYDGQGDIANQAETTVTFTLTPIDTGTRLTVLESGFENLPEHRRIPVMRDNTSGWEIQLGNIAAHVA